MQEDFVSKAQDTKESTVLQTEISSAEPSKKVSVAQSVAQNILQSEDGVRPFVQEDDKFRAFFTTSAVVLPKDLMDEEEEPSSLWEEEESESFFSRLKAQFAKRVKHSKVQDEEEEEDAGLFFPAQLNASAPTAAEHLFTEEDVLTLATAKPEPEPEQTPTPEPMLEAAAKPEPEPEQTPKPVKKASKKIAKKAAQNVSEEVALPPVPVREEAVFEKVDLPPVPVQVEAVSEEVELPPVPAQTNVRAKAVEAAPAQAEAVSKDALINQVLEEVMVAARQKELTQEVAPIVEAPEPKAIEAQPEVVPAEPEAPTEEIGEMELQAVAKEESKPKEMTGVISFFAAAQERAEHNESDISVAENPFADDYLDDETDITGLEQFKESIGAGAKRLRDAVLAVPFIAGIFAAKDAKATEADDATLDGTGVVNAAAQASFDAADEMPEMDLSAAFTQEVVLETVTPVIKPVADAPVDAAEEAVVTMPESEFTTDTTVITDPAIIETLVPEPTFLEELALLDKMADDITSKTDVVEIADPVAEPAEEEPAFEKPDYCMFSEEEDEAAVQVAPDAVHFVPAVPEGMESEVVPYLPPQAENAGDAEAVDDAEATENTEAAEDAEAAENTEVAEDAEAAELTAASLEDTLTERSAMEDTITTGSLFDAFEEEETTRLIDAPQPVADADLENTEDTFSPFEESEAPAQKASEAETHALPEDSEGIEYGMNGMWMRLLIRTLTTGVFGVTLFLLGLMGQGVIAPIAAIDPASAVVPFLLVNLLFMSCAALVSYPVFIDGFVGLWKKPTPDTLPAIAAVAAILQLMICLALADSFDAMSVTLFSSMAGFVLFADALGSLMMAGVIRNSFAVANTAVPHYLGYRVKNRETLRTLSKDSEVTSPDVLVSRPVQQMVSFLEKSFAPRESDKRAQLISYALLGGAAVAYLIALVKGGGLIDAMSSFAGVLCIGAPFSITLLAALPSALMQRSAAKVGAMVPGWEDIEDLDEINLVAVDAKELFPPVCAQLCGIKTFQKERLDLAILYATSILVGRCDTLSNLFSGMVCDDVNILYPVKDLECRAGLGYIGWCENYRVIVGNRTLLEAEGISVPMRDYEDRFSKNGKYQVLYLAVSGQLYAMFTIGYRGEKGIARTLHTLRKEHVRLLVNCTDPTLTAERIEKVYHLPSGFITLLVTDQVTALSAATTYRAKGEGCMLHLGSFASFVGGLKAASGAAQAERGASALQMIAVGFSILLSLFLCITGGLMQVALVAILLYQVAWSALTLGVVLTKKFE